MGKASPIIANIRHKGIDHLIGDAIPSHTVGTARTSLCPAKYARRNSRLCSFISVYIMGNGAQFRQQCSSGLCSPLITANTAICMNVQFLQTGTDAHKIGGVQGVVQSFLRQASSQCISVGFPFCIQQSRCIFADPVVDILIGNIRLGVVYIRQAGVVGIVGKLLVDLLKTGLSGELEPEGGNLLLCGIARGASLDNWQNQRNDQ